MLQRGSLLNVSSNAYELPPRGQAKEMRDGCQRVSTISMEVQTPCLVFDEIQLRTSLEKIRKAASHAPVEFLYSMKACSTTFVLKLIAEGVSGFSAAPYTRLAWPARYFEIRVQFTLQPQHSPRPMWSSWPQSAISCHSIHFIRLSAIDNYSVAAQAEASG